MHMVNCSDVEPQLRIDVINHLSVKGGGRQEIGGRQIVIFVETVIKNYLI